MTEAGVAACLAGLLKSVDINELYLSPMERRVLRASIPRLALALARLGVQVSVTIPSAPEAQ